MGEPDWYDFVEGSVLLQGDLLCRCPVFTLKQELSWPLLPNTNVALGAREVDVVVLTQSCDLENDKIADVLLGQLFAWPETVRIELQRGNSLIRSLQFRKQLIAGNVPALSLLHKREDQPCLPWSVVNFHHLYTLPKPFLRQFAASCGPRLRLRSPYREHLAQAFARYFMRVGLPHDAKAFEKEGDVKI